MKTIKKLYLVQLWMYCPDRDINYLRSYQLEESIESANKLKTAGENDWKTQNNYVGVKIQEIDIENYFTQPADIFIIDDVDLDDLD